MSSLVKLEGATFGKLTVLRLAEKPWKHDSEWICLCTCGKTVRVRGGNLKSGHTKSCGNCNTYMNIDNGVKCTVGSGRSFIIDEEDLAIVSQYKWSVDKNGYALGIRNNTERVKLHRLLLGFPDGVVDHIDGNPSNNKKNNLRCTTQHRNSQNSALPKNSTTGYKGVCWDKREQKYMAHIHPNRKMVFLGYYDSPIDAAMAYDRAAFLCFGEYARPNFMKGETPNEGKQEILELAAVSEGRDRAGCKTRASA